MTDFSRVTPPGKADPSSGKHRHTKPISPPQCLSPLCFLVFLFDTNFSTMCPQETCGTEWVQGCLGRAQERRGDLCSSREIRSLNHSDPWRTPPGWALCGVRPVQTQPDDHPRRGPPCRPLSRTPGSMLPPDQHRAPRPPPGTSRTRGGLRTRRLPGSQPPYLSGQGLRARVWPHRQATFKTLPVPPRPALVGCPTRRPTPLGPPYALPPLSPRGSLGAGNILLFPENKSSFKTVRWARPRRRPSGTKLDTWSEIRACALCLGSQLGPQERGSS